MVWIYVSTQDTYSISDGSCVLQMAPNSNTKLYFSTNILNKKNQSNFPTVIIFTSDKHNHCQQDLGDYWEKYLLSVML